MKNLDQFILFSRRFERIRGFSFYFSLISCPIFILCQFHGMIFFPIFVIFICVVIFCKLKLMMESILGMDTFLAEHEICEKLIKDFDLIFSIHITVRFQAMINKSQQSRYLSIGCCQGPLPHYKKAYQTKIIRAVSEKSAHSEYF